MVYNESQVQISIAARPDPKLDAKRYRASAAPSAHSNPVCNARHQSPDPRRRAIPHDAYASSFKCSEECRGGSRALRIGYSPYGRRRLRERLPHIAYPRIPGAREAPGHGLEYHYRPLGAITVTIHYSQDRDSGQWRGVAGVPQTKREGKRSARRRPARGAADRPGPLHCRIDGQGVRRGNGRYSRRDARVIYCNARRHHAKHLRPAATRGDRIFIGRYRSRRPSRC